MANTDFDLGWDGLEMVNTGTKVLVADDSSTIRAMVKRELEAARPDLDIHLASDGLEAVEKLSAEEFDIAFLDIMMPHLSGIDVIATALKSERKTMAVSMSTNLSDDDASRLKRFGAYDFLTKPVTAEDIRNVLNAYDRITEPANVMIVDDSPTVCKIVAMVLERSLFNLEVTTAPNGKAALKHAEAKDFRIVFTDYNMPEMNGIELAAALAQRGHTSDVIMMSTDISASLNKSAEEVGARAFLKKPFFPEDVDSILHHMFGLRHARFSKHVKLLAE